MNSIVRLAALLAMLAAAPVFAKDAHLSHGHGSHHSVKATIGRSAGQVRGREALPPSVHEEPVIEPAPEPRSAKTQSIVIRAKAPAKNETRRINSPTVSPGRNAIGMTVAPSHPASVSGGVHPKAPAVVSALPKATISAPPHPIVSASVGSPNKIGGASVIRPAASLSGLGGPAKTASGINGTTMRSKHY
ncbi:MAG TPA: hypothetical protein VH206_00275 [Xanthobacteraceae bacterium]|nr:hypothetical protein [Xanthobacteraceae bacterium]